MPFRHKKHFNRCAEVTMVIVPQPGEVQMPGLSNKRPMVVDARGTNGIRTGLSYDSGHGFSMICVMACSRLRALSSNIAVCVSTSSRWPLIR